MKNQQQEQLDPKEVRNRLAELRRARTTVSKTIKDLDKRYRSVSALMKEEATKLDQAILIAEALLEDWSKFHSNNLDESEAVDSVEGAGREFNKFTMKLGEVCPDLSRFLTDDVTQLQHGLKPIAQNRSSAA